MSCNNLYERCLEVVLNNEGGYVEDNDDNGGATNLGISLLFLKGLRDIDGDGFLDGDINKDGIVNELDAKSVDYEDAKRLYKDYFWDKYYCSILDEELALQIFDMGVNAGKGRAIKIVQSVVGVKEDGVIGDITISEINNTPNLCELYKIARKDYYSNIVSRNPKLKKFVKGWFNRVDKTHF